MSATLPLSCIAETGDKPCKNEGEYTIYLANVCYPICKEHYEWLGKIKQLGLRDWFNHKFWKKIKKG